MRLWIFCFLVLCAASSRAYSDYQFDDDLYDGTYEYQHSDEYKDEATVDKDQLDDVSKNYGKVNEDVENAENGFETIVSPIGDYQFEDNRSSEPNDKQNIVEEPTDPLNPPVDDEDNEDEDAGNEEIPENYGSEADSIVEEPIEEVNSQANNEGINAEDSGNEEKSVNGGSDADDIVQESNKPVNSSNEDENIEEKDADHAENPENYDPEAGSIVEEPTELVDSPADYEGIEAEDAGNKENPDNDGPEADDIFEEPNEPVNSPADDEDIEEKDTGSDENPENDSSETDDIVEEPNEPVVSPAEEEDNEDKDAGNEENPENYEYGANSIVEEPTEVVDSPADDEVIKAEDAGNEEISKNDGSEANDMIKEPNEPVDLSTEDEDIEEKDAGYEEIPENYGSEADSIVEEPTKLVDLPADDEGIEAEDVGNEENPKKYGLETDDIVEEPREPVHLLAEDEAIKDKDADYEENPENDGSKVDDIIEDPNKLVDSPTDDEGIEDKYTGYEENPENGSSEVNDDYHLMLEDNNEDNDNIIYKFPDVTEEINLDEMVNTLLTQMNRHDNYEESQDKNDITDEEHVKDNVIINREDNDDSNEKQLDDMAQKIDYSNNQETQNESDEDTVIKVYADLDDDLKKLLQTLKKLHEDDAEENSNGKDDDSVISRKDNVSEGDVDTIYQKIDDKNDLEMNQDGNNDQNTAVKPEVHAEDDATLSSTITTVTEENEDAKISPTAYKDYDSGAKTVNQDKNENTNYSDIDQETITFPKENRSKDYDDSTVEAPSIPQAIEQKTTGLADPEYIHSNDKNNYADDSISDDSYFHNKYAVLYSTVSIITEENKDDGPSDATPEQYDVLMKKFIAEHSKNIKSDYFDPQTINISSPVFVALTDETAFVIESPNYPNHYPIDNVIEYYINAQSTGIELNITDFMVNGNAGDYLLVKPGGVYASDADALVISYHLSEKHMFTFLDVDRLYLRFYTGSLPRKGFQLSVRMLYKQEITTPDQLPISLTVALGGRTPMNFNEVEEDFRRLIAEMADAYVESSDIDPKLMVDDTRRAAQITTYTSCTDLTDKWDGLNCVKVTFHVPVIYGDGRDVRFNLTDLSTMWYTYHKREPYASALQNMGLRVQWAQHLEHTGKQLEYQQSHMLTVWMVIGAGVFISVTMLAVAIWRFSCFKGYTRMPAYSDSDSMTKKQVLDMYPTPHQTLPALYAEQRLKWDDDKFHDTTRVDLDGYANIAFAHKLLDMESDDDVKTTPRDRNSISPSDVYQV